MTANEIRKKYLEFFKSKQHSVIASDSLVPKDDPTVLFTTAGMQQFKRQFLGHIDGFTRAATSQKCLRTDDLDKIGKTPCHHTFFEMLGNFSFGDYFKREAIAWAWEFLTKVVNLSGERLWVSVYEEDQEAYDEWVNLGFPKDKIVKLGDKDNFWPAEAQKKGPNGPCGPCTEIFFDYFPAGNPDCKNKKCDPSCNCGRFTEVWNLVFTQFNRKDGGVLEPLPGKNIDTGMGLERLTAVLQGVKSNYDTDLFVPIRSAIQKEICQGKLTLGKADELVISDHIRAIVFAISDGVIPSNKERGSVVKRLINDATNFVLNAGGTEPSIYKLVPTVLDIFKSQYPEIVSKADELQTIIRRTEEAFIQVRKERIPEFETKFPQAKNAQDRGELLFMYRDTYGLPLPTMTNLSIVKTLSTHEQAAALENYHHRMAEQQERARSASKMTGQRFADIQLDLSGTPKTIFTGYTQLEGPAKVLKLFVEDREAKKASAGDYVKVILDQTPFYAEAGGQIGDSGTLTNANATIHVVDTQKQDGIYIHFATVEKGEINVGNSVEADVDEERRVSIMRNHTATHILQAGLRKILGTHVQQQGSLVAEDRLRFDFTHPQAITPDQKKQIEDFVNSSIRANEHVDKKEMPIEEAKKLGALSFFAEKYGAQVRVVSIGHFSKEFCGGTHLNSTGEIEKFRLTSEGAVAQGIRRVEAKTAEYALRFEEDQLREEQEKLRREQERQKQKEQAKGRFESIKNSLETIIQEAKIIQNTKIICKGFADLELEDLRKVADLLKQKERNAVLVLGTKTPTNAYILTAVPDELVKTGLSANDVIKETIKSIEGNGGGKPQLAQAGIKDIANFEKALEKTREIISTKIQN